MELDPIRSNYYVNRGSVYYYLREDNLALKDFQYSLNLDHYDPHPYHNIGVIKFEQGDLWAAYSDFCLSISLDTDFATPYYFRAIVLSKLRYHIQALADLRMYKQLGGGEIDEQKKNLEQVTRELQINTLPYFSLLFFPALGLLIRTLARDLLARKK